MFLRTPSDPPDHRFSYVPDDLLRALGERFRGILPPRIERPKNVPCIPHSIFSHKRSLKQKLRVAYSMIRCARLVNTSVEYSPRAS
jgi:hypothetical protein